MWVAETSCEPAPASPAGFQKSASAPWASVTYESPMPVARAVGMTLRNWNEVVPTFWASAALAESASTTARARRVVVVMGLSG